MRLLAVCAIALTFGFVGSVPIAGPVALMVLARGADRRFGEAVRIGLGAAVAEGIYAGVAFWGFATFLARHRWVIPASRGATAVLLIGLGVRFALWRPADRKNESEHRGGKAFVGFTVAALNPTLLLTWSAVVALAYSWGLGGQPALVSVPFGACATAGVSGWVFSFVPLLRACGGKLPRAATTWLVRAIGLALIGLGAWSGVKLATAAAQPVNRPGAPNTAEVSSTRCPPATWPLAVPSCPSWSTGDTTSA
ncbi:MAG: LysE family transporter [Polyangiaceae bacterium]|jgi:threonine/homoserine/homoserine lactone efflux protein